MEYLLFEKKYPYVKFTIKFPLSSMITLIRWHFVLESNHFPTDQGSMVHLQHQLRLNQILCE